MKKTLLFVALIVGVACVYAIQHFPTAPPAPTTPPPVCGDGAVQPPELCDDGNQVPGDGCENDCTFTPPPPPSSDCTPGYWKNHLEVWWGMGCGGAISDATLDDMLSPEDGGLGRMRENREAAAGLLNSCVGVTPNCD